MSAYPYTIVYNQIVNHTYTPIEFETVKLLFMEEINSKRRYYAIKTMPELLRVLEKRDCLNPNKFEPLQRITKLLGPSVLNLSYAEAPINNNFIQRPVVIPEMPSDPKGRAYSLIASDLGKKWPDFARAVGLREGEIDQLNNLRSVSDRVYKILRFHDENCDRRHWRSSLLNALREARRSDLSNKVQNIFDIN